MAGLSRIGFACKKGLTLGFILFAPPRKNNKESKCKEFPNVSYI